MPTAPSSPDSASVRLSEVRRAVADLRHLLWFRAATLNRPRVVVIALAVFGAVTLLSATVPAWIDLDPAVLARATRALPAALAAVAAISVASAIAGGGGRELLARDPASIHPISPVTDHLGALVLAPLNTGWLLQTWLLLGFTAVVAGPERLLGVQLLTLAWVVAATVLGQVVAWGVEWVRRGPRGARVVRIGVAVALGVLAGVGATPDVRQVLVAGPARIVATAIERGSAGAIALITLTLLVGGGVLVVLGARLATLAATRMPRDEGRQETRAHAPRPTPSSPLAMMVRVDRASVWRSVPLRRGTLLLAIAPGLVALAGGLRWETLILLPGLVASGCVLLFGVNLWCLDGRGMLWRETLPVAPRTVLVARAWVLAEVLFGAALITIVLGSVRAGMPTPAEALAVVLALVTVVGQAVSAGLRWSEKSPYAVDLRSARATPAPPLTMVGYSLRLALTTTFTGLYFATLAALGRPLPMLAVAVVLLAISAFRIVRASRRWSDPVRRSAVVGVVAA
ncbi:MAG: hypothetical protein NTX33_01735 [Propionibacteriales bacterium]|nr:hypothetical protein [Propionibacteriales bacterium]